MLERLIAKLGTIGILAILLSASVLLNLWQFNRAGKADARCATRIAEMVADVDRKTAANEVTALDIGRQADKDASTADDRIEKETIRYVDRIRREIVTVPAECDGPMPDGVHDALSDATRAANSFVPAR